MHRYTLRFVLLLILALLILGITKCTTSAISLIKASM